MTSNLGARDISKGRALGFSGDERESTLPYDKLKERVMGELKRVFRPEFLNRVDEVIVFHELAVDEINSIVDLMVSRLRDQLLQHGIGIVLSDDARILLGKEGFDSALGARPLRRAIQRLVEDPLSEQILAGQWVSGDVIEVAVEHGECAFRKSDLKVSSFEKPKSPKNDAGSPLLPPSASGGGTSTAGDSVGA
jgi:ATP-dependent Clp protease ATP-binding subunit ClpC